MTGLICENEKAKRSLQNRVDAGVQRILSEVRGDRQAAINRLLQLHWEEGEAVEEIDRCRAVLNGGRRETKRATASGG